MISATNKAVEVVACSYSSIFSSYLWENVQEQLILKNMIFLEQEHDENNVVAVREENPFCDERFVHIGCVFVTYCYHPSKISERSVRIDPNMSLLQICMESFK